ncbi:MAG: hypothetical protein AAF664_23820, partial [Planctomycetota bacterium]
PSQLYEVYGGIFLATIGFQAWSTFQQDILNRDIVHVSDAQAWMREELGAAYELLQTDAAQAWWNREQDGNRHLYQMIRSANMTGIKQYRDAYLESLNADARLTAIGALSWCIFVESILLNERMNADIRETLGTRPVGYHGQDWQAYFGPNPPPCARDSFADYVAIRWPLRVFAIDPVNTEQNIADISSVYRQMQIAVAMSYAAGDIGISMAMQAMRKLQRDRATIDLNRIAVGYANGDNKFGWRFYPRFQTPPVESNLTVLFRDLIVGGPTDRQLERSSEIEPGMRECLALVLMPSFVPHVTLKTRSSWFCLDKPGHTTVRFHDTVKFSRSLKNIEERAQCLFDCADRYRPEEMDLMLARVDQLNAKLPTQRLECQVPIENTLGGFEILSSGQKELAPELLGWYGAPGYDPRSECTLFLSGDNLSVHETRLIAGNKAIPFRLLSRQIMEVSLPAGLPVLRDQKLVEANPEFYDGYVDAHIATPYGVSGHLLIPVIRQSVFPAITKPQLVPRSLVMDVVHNAGAITEMNIIDANTGVSQLLTVQVPDDLGLRGRENVKTNIRFSEGSFAVADVNSLDMTVDRVPGQYVISKAEIAEESKPDGSVATALADYVRHHVTVLKLSSFERNLNASASIEFISDSGDVPVSGNMPVRLRVKPVPPSTP